MTDEHDTEQLHKTQFERETMEHKLADATDDEHETAQHERRAAKVSYLRRLEERAESERRLEE